MPTDPELRGRDVELEALDGLLDAVKAGESRVLVVRGEPGVGKTALLEHVARRASGCLVARSGGVQSEMELAFAGLQQLCAPILDRLDRLPRPQRDALATAFGLRAGDPPDRFLVGLAALSLVSEVSDEQPLMCLIDDAHWLDRASAQALAFVGRRLLAEPVALVFAVRERSEELTGLPELVVRGLRNGDARALLDSVVTSPMDERVRDRIVAETGGNPLALLELPRGLTADQLAGGFALPDALAVPGRIEESFGRRLDALPPETRRLLLVAAADPVGESTLVWRAAERLEVGADAARPAIAAGLVEFGERVRFRHPLVRSAVYQAASSEDRRAVHRALAQASDPELDADRRAWHRAHATAGPDEDVAQELESSAGRAHARGGLAAAAAFLSRATALTPDPARRGKRALAAAQAKLQAGAFDAASALLGIAEAAPLDELERVRVDLLRAQIAFALSHGSDAALLLLKAAGRLEGLDVTLARDTYRDAFWAAMFVGRLARGGGVREVARAARAAPASDPAPRAPDLLLDGLALLIEQGYSAGAPQLQRAVDAFRSAELSTDEGLRWLRLAGRAAVDLWDYEGWHALSTREVQLARATGALSVLPIALSTRIGVHMFAGELTAAASLIGEVQAIGEATGSQFAPYGAIGVAAWQGREGDVVAVIEANANEMFRRGEGVGLGLIHWASALLYNGLSRHEEALVAAQRATESPDELLFFNWGLIELVEAVARVGKAERAADALERLSEMGRATGSDWALGVEARSRALVGDDEGVEPLYQEAIDRLGRTGVRVELARAHLLYGEWLRGERRSGDARQQLRTADTMFTEMGAGAFAERTRRELQATGVTARRRPIGSTDQLTEQEAQIARLARDGLTNPEIGARLFISPRTVEYHLHKVFTKLAIASRAELIDALTDGAVAWRGA